jgi:hypothetical protein
MELLSLWIGDQMQNSGEESFLRVGSTDIEPASLQGEDIEH